ncbi:MAG TPA: hypothetical protein PLU26_15320 [Candidatus Competibacter sp.]|nr:hypothetical protein [Candidatus Competibacter sp.]
MNHKPFWIAGLLAMLLAGCDDPPPKAPPSRPPVAQAPAAPAPQLRAPSKQEQFLARIKGSAAGNNVIRDARMNRDNELGVVFDTQVKLDQVRPLMTTLLREMRDEFPGRPLMVIGYAPNGQAMATMGYDPSAPADSNVSYKPNF